MASKSGYTSYLEYKKMFDSLSTPKTCLEISELTNIPINTVWIMVRSLKRLDKIKVDHYKNTRYRKIAYYTIK